MNCSDINAAHSPEDSRIRAPIMTKKTDTRSAYDEVLERATQVFGSLQVAEEWMHSPVRALCNQTPACAITNDRVQVEAMLRKIETGDFS